MWFFPWIKLPWYSCSMWDKLGWLNWFWQFLCEGLSSFNPKRFYYSYAWSWSLCARRTSFSTGFISRKFCGFLLSQMTSLKWLTFLLLSFLLWLTQSSSFGFLSSDASICSTMAYPPFENSDHVLMSVFINFPIDSKQDALFHQMAYDYSCADWDVTWKHVFITKCVCSY